jgi:hypothetical protein
MFRVLCFVVALLFCFKGNAQQILFLDQQPTVTVNGSLLKFPWAGGINSAIINEIDLNGDGIKDLMLFDRVGNRLSTYLNAGTAGVIDYQYAPQYVNIFPAMHDWARTVDYDCDGDMDLFTYTNNSMGVYRNDALVGGNAVFTFVTSQVISNYGSLINSIFVSQVNMPALVDVDGDSDMDVITFSNSGNYLEYHRNAYFDSTGLCGGFDFYLQPYCWGNFKLSGLSNIGLLNQSCRAAVVNDEQEIQRNRHAGSVLTPLDQGCDGDVDLLNGDILGINMLYLENGGDADSANITSQDSLFPVYDVTVNLQNLPAAYYIDLDNDSNKDMIVTPFATVGQDFYNMHFYKNNGTNCTNVFNLVQDRFLIEDMMDVGTASSVAFFDVDNDGLQDIVAGNDLYYNASQVLAVSRLAYFRNTGTSTNPSFTLITDDWLSLSTLSQYSMYPSFGDVDNDGDKDLLLGNGDGTLIYYQNTSTSGAANFVFTNAVYQGIDVGNNAAPQVIDVNRDGLNDLLVGERGGILNYFQNIGSIGSPAYAPNATNFGTVNVVLPSTVAGYSAPLLFDRGNGYELLVGADNGKIFHYSNIDGNLTGSFTLVDSMFQGIFEPKRVTLAITDIDGDSKFDLLTGNNAGGFRLYTQDSSLGITNENETEKLDFSVFPNPASNLVTLNFKQTKFAGYRKIEILNILGETVLLQQAIEQLVSIDLSSLQSGIYILRVSDNTKYVCRKVIKSN